MEFVGQPGPSGACNLLGVPALSPLEVDDDDECDLVIGIRPKSSPLPRRRSCESDDDSEPEPPQSGSRRVSFADAKGLSLVQVKKFDTWDVPNLPEFDASEGAGKDAEAYFLSPLTFSLPLSTEELLVRVREQKVELETVELVPGTTILKGVIRVLNVSFDKAVYVRTTLDTWTTHFDLLTEYMPGSSDSLTDRFSFRLTLVPPLEEQGARVDFCLRYETPVGTFWANNNNRNYVLLCHQRMKDRKETPLKERVNKKSCLKTVSQSFSAEENNSTTEAPSQEMISTDVTEHGDTVDTVKAKQISDGQSGTSEEDRQKLLTESRQNCSRRSRRKAARVALVKDYFSLRNGEADDTERGESPPKENQAAQEETPEQKHSDVRSFPEGASKSEGSHFVSESPETCSESLTDVPHDTSHAHDHTSDSETEISESINLADSATLTGGERATDIQDNPSNDEPASAECQNINKSVSKAEESSQKQSTSNECISSIAAQPPDISERSGEHSVSQTNSFSFGTVVAPLYHQVFGRVGNESGWRNPVQATLHAGDSSYPRCERRQTSCSVKTDARGNHGEAQGHVIKNLKCLVTNSPPVEKEETSLSLRANNIPDHAETLRYPVDIIHSDQRRTNTSEVPKTISGDTVAHSHTANILSTDLLIPQKPAESLHLQGEAQEDNLTHDPKLPENTYTQTKTDLDDTLADSETEEVKSSLMSLRPSKNVSDRVIEETDQKSSDSAADDSKLVHESNKEDDVCETVTITSATVVSEKDKAFKALHDLNPKHMKNSATEETEISYVSCFEILEEKDVTRPQISLETYNVEEGNKVVNNPLKEETKQSAEEEIIGEVAEATTKATITNHMHGDMSVELKDEDTQNIEHHEKEAAVAQQEDLCFADTTDVNWEMMVEEEEKNILAGEEEKEAMSLKTEGKDQRQLEDAGRETALENKDATEVEKEHKLVWEITAATEKKNEAEDADVSEGKKKFGEEIWEIMAETDREEVAKELENVQGTNEAGEEDLAEEIEEEKREKQEETELEKEKLFAEVNEVDILKTNVQNEEEIEEEEEMEIDLSDDDEAGVEWEDQVKPREVNLEEENPDYKEEILVETGESEIIDAESESMTIEDWPNEAGCFEVRLDITQNKVRDCSSAPVNNVQDKRVIGRENGHIPTEMHLYEEEDFQSKEHHTHDLTQAAGDENESLVADGSSFIFTDEPENDQTSEDSASAESDSDDEVELYMHCIRAVHGGAQAQTDRNKDTGFGAGKLRPSISRSKSLPTRMPSISESQDEEQHPNRLLDNPEEMEKADVQPTAAASGQESIDRNVSWWKETFSCSNISKTLLYATSFVVFLVVAYRYDFLAYFGLYLISVVWLYCQEKRPPKQQKKTTEG